MQHIILDAEAGQLPAELARRGIAARVRVHALVGVADSSEPPMAAIAEAGNGLDGPADESNLYPNADLVHRLGQAFAFGNFALTCFPFTDLLGNKRRSALVVSCDNHRRPDLLACFIASTPRIEPDMVLLAAIARNGFKFLSAERFDKLAAFDRSGITGSLGEVSGEWLQEHRATFFGVSGLGQP